MLGFPLGILSAAGAAVVDTDAYEFISSTILAGTAASVTFSSLGDYSSTYKHLQIRYAARTSRSELNDGLRVRVNANTTEYAQHALRGNGSTVTSSFDNQTRLISLPVPGNTATASAFGAGVIDLLDSYSTTKNKTARGLGGIASSFNQLELQSGVFINTAAISSIELASVTGNNLSIGSRFSLYGIKG
jgi:hypothetical protein